MFSKSTVTLNIETNDIRFLVSRGKRIVDWGSLPLPAGLVKQGLVVEPARVSSAIDTLFSEKKLPKSNVVAGLTGLRSVIRILTLPKLKKSLLEEAIQHEAEREMPVPLAELYLSRQLLGAEGSERRYLVLGVPRDLLDSEIRTLASAGIRPRNVSLKPLALARAANREEALIINLELDAFDLVAVVGGMPAAMRTVMLRGKEMAPEDVIGQVTDELSRTIAFHNSSHPEHPLGPATPVFLTGLLATDTTTSYLVKAAIENPIESLAPALECPPDLPLAQYAVNIGLALARTPARSVASIATARTRVVNPNVLPTKYATQTLSLAHALYPIAAITLVVLALLMYQINSTSEADIAGIQDELDAVNQQLGTVSDVDDPLAASIDKAEAEAEQLNEQRVSILSALATSNLGSNLQQVLGALPRGVQLTSISETEDDISLDGSADNRHSVADYVVALERTGLFSEVYATSVSGAVEDASIAFSVQGTIDTAQ